MAIQDVITHVQAAMPTWCTKVIFAPDYVSDDVSKYPVSALAYARNIRRVHNSAGWGTTLFDLYIDILTPQGTDMQADYTHLAGIPEDIYPHLELDPTIGGHATTYGGFTADITAAELAGTRTIGWRVVILDIKLNS